MGVTETAATVLVLLLALYGCVCAIKSLILFMVTPRKKHVHLELAVDAAVEGIEQQVRYALTVSKQNGLMLYLVDRGMTSEQRKICDRLISCPTNDVSKT